MEQGRITSSGNVITSSGFTNQGLIYNSSSNIGMGDPNPSFKFTVTSSKMKQVKAALFTVKRDPKTNEIIDSEFVKEFWVKQKPGVSFELAALFANGHVIDPDTEVVREIISIHF